MKFPDWVLKKGINGFNTLTYNIRNRRIEDYGFIQF